MGDTQLRRLVHKRLHGEIGIVTPAMLEAAYFAQRALVDNASLKAIESL